MQTRHNRATWPFVIGGCAFIAWVCLIVSMIGCQSQTRTTPATSHAERQVDEKRGGTTFRVIVEPVAPPQPKATVTP